MRSYENTLIALRMLKSNATRDLATKCLAKGGTLGGFK